MKQINIFNGIFDNIKERGLLFEAKCKIPLSTLSDAEILEKAKDAKNLDNKFNEILGWITELVKASPSNCAQAEEALMCCMIPKIF